MSSPFVSIAVLRALDRLSETIVADVLSVGCPTCRAASDSPCTTTHDKLEARVAYDGVFHPERFVLALTVRP